MAQWEKCMRLTGQFLEQLKALYGHRLPIEVRHYLANWMEAQSWWVHPTSIFKKILISFLLDTSHYTLEGELTLFSFTLYTLAGIVDIHVVSCRPTCAYMYMDLEKKFMKHTNVII